MPSFSVRCLFRWLRRQDESSPNLYEERITLWEAESIDQAIALAEGEALEYVSDGEEYLGYCQAYALAEPIAAHGVEVFSLVRESNLEPSEYIDTFFNTGAERHNH